MESDRKSGGYGRTAKTALAAMLVWLLLVATTLSANHALHESLHHDSAGNGHFCLVCFFAKGQVSAAPIAFIAALVVFYCLGNVRPARTPVFPGFDYRLSPSRAPP